MVTQVGKGDEVIESYFGIPFQYSNLVTNRLLWTRSTKYDENGEENVRSKRSSNTLIMPIDFDFTQREYTIKFFDFWDILAKIGGLRAAIFPFFMFFMPLLVLYFLIELSTITKERNE